MSVFEWYEVVNAHYNMDKVVQFTKNKKKWKGASNVINKMDYEGIHELYINVLHQVPRKLTYIISIGTKKNIDDDHQRYTICGIKFVKSNEQWTVSQNFLGQTDGMTTHIAWDEVGRIMSDTINRFTVTFNSINNICSLNLNDHLLWAGRLYCFVHKPKLELTIAIENSTENITVIENKYKYIATHNNY